MPLNPICKHYSMETPCSVFDEEALTALQLAGRTAGKVNEVVKAFNELEDAVPHLIEKDVNEHIDNGHFEEAIDRHLGNLGQRVDNLVNTVPPGSTTMDAEVIDGRLDADGNSHLCLGEAIRQQFGKSLRAMPPIETDVDKMTNPGFYFKGGSDNWTNVPDTMSAGVIVTFAPDPAAYPSRVVQLAIDYNGIISVRNKTTGFTPWKPYAPATSSMARKATVDGESYDANTLTESGYYHIGSSQTIRNTPTDYGMLIVYQGHLATQVYQMWFDHETCAIYTRDYKYNYGFRDWVKLGNDLPTVISSSEDNYTVRKVNDKLFYIYKKGKNGYIRYGIAEDHRTDIGLKTTRLESIAHVNDQFYLIREITTSGADVEGVIQLPGTYTYTDAHVGGVHGNETASETYIFVNGTMTTMQAIKDGVYNDIRIVVKSSIKARPEYAPAPNGWLCDRVKQITFDRTGVHIHNKWGNWNDAPLASIRAGMLSINKGNVSHYYDTSVNAVPQLVPSIDAESKKLVDSEHITEMCFVGNVSIRQWFEKAYWSDSVPDGYTHCLKGTFFLQDYGNRLKSYFTVCDGGNPCYDTIILTTNHFTIEC